MTNFKDFESKFLNEEVLNTFGESFTDEELADAVPAFMTFTNMRDIVDTEVETINGFTGTVFGVKQVKEMIGRISLSNPDVVLFKNNTLE